MQADSPRPSCVVVGAGVSGLAAARTLADAGIDVTVLDKGRGVGGRLATRRIGAGVFDHGAQAFTVRDPRFSAVVEDWLSADAVRHWTDAFHDAAARQEARAMPRLCGTHGMTSIPKHLARGLEVKLAQRVVELNQWDGRWEVVTESGLFLQADAVILTPPVPQLLELLTASRIHLPTECHAVLRAVRYEPCLALMVLLDGPSAVPAPGAVMPADGPVSWIADNTQKGISPDAHAVTIHASAEYSRAHLEGDAHAIVNALIAAAQPWLGANVTEHQLHRWRYSLPVNNVGEPCMLVPEFPPLVFAGDGFGAARVEGAYFSGLSAARMLLESVFSD